MCPCPAAPARLLARACRRPPPPAPRGSDTSPQRASRHAAAADGGAGCSSGCHRSRPAGRARSRVGRHPASAPHGRQRAEKALCRRSAPAGLSEPTLRVALPPPLRSSFPAPRAVLANGRCAAPRGPRRGRGAARSAALPCARCRRLTRCERARTPRPPCTCLGPARPRSPEGEEAARFPRHIGGRGAGSSPGSAGSRAPLRALPVPPPCRSEGGRAPPPFSAQPPPAARPRPRDVNVSPRGAPEIPEWTPAPSRELLPPLEPRSRPPASSLLPSLFPFFLPSLPPAAALGRARGGAARRRSAQPRPSASRHVLRPPARPARSVRWRHRPAGRGRPARGHCTAQEGPELRAPLRSVSQ